MSAGVSLMGVSFAARLVAEIPPTIRDGPVFDIPLT
jgi:hypothetical protein